MGTSGLIEVAQEAMMVDQRKDRDDIADLLNRYAFALDQKRWDWLDTVFTEEVVVDFPGGFSASGRADVVALIRGFVEKCAATHHLITNHYAVIDGDNAEGSCDVRSHHARKGGEGRFEESLATFNARCRRTRDGWRIQLLSEKILIALGGIWQRCRESLSCKLLNPV